MNSIIFILKRLPRMVGSLVAVSFLAFALLQLAPGSFSDIQQVAGGSGGINNSGNETGAAEGSASTSPTNFMIEYLTVMKGVVTWDMGPSYQYPGRTIEGIIGEAFPVSATLAILAVVLALLVALPVGTIAALRQNSRMDHTLMFVSTLGNSLPNYLIAAFLILLFTATLHLLPSGGWDGPVDLILPVLALALGPIAVLTRYVRSSVLDTMREEYVTAALAKGGSRSTILIRHVLRNSLIPLVTVVGPLLAGLMTGTVFVEALFRIPGLGYYAATAATSRDMPLLMGTVVFFAVVIMVMNLLVDLVYGILDPRIRNGRGWASSRRSRARIEAV